MKLYRNTKVILVFTVAFLTTAAIYSQNLMQKDPHRELEQAATEAAEHWEKELSLTAKQFDLMRRKLVEFAIKKDELLQSKMREDAKTARLKELQVLENRDMRDILTKPQYDRYILLLRQRVRELSQKS